MKTFLYKKLIDLPQSMQKLVKKIPSTLPKDWHVIRAKSPWQDMLWLIFLSFAGIVFLLLSALMLFESANKTISTLIFLIPAIIALWAANTKKQNWQNNNTFLIFTPDYLIERTNKIASIIPWNKVKSAEIGLPKKPLIKKQVPSVTVKTEEGDLFILCGQRTNFIDEPYDVLWHNLVPGVMLFSTQPAFYTENEFAIKKKIDEYLKKYKK